jgi:phosphoserine phosphatase RsbU/P
MTTPGTSVIEQLACAPCLWGEDTLAHSIQRTVVPTISYHGIHVEAYGRTIPREALGGDLVDLVAADEDVIAYVADVSGHGIGAGVLMGMLKTATRYGLMFGQSLTSLLEGINRVLPSVKPPNMFATFAGLRFTGADEAECIVAGHFPILHFRRRQRDVVRRSMEQFPLGLFPDANYRSSRVRYEAGDLFALITDGVVETADAHDEEFGLERVEDILCKLAGRPLPEIFEAALAAVGEYGIQQDDRTLMLVRVLG